MSDAHPYFGELPIDRYGKPMAALLLDYLNHQNNRLFTLSQVQFGQPIAMGGDGLVSTPVQFSEDTAFDQEAVSYLSYHRPAVRDVIPNGQFTIHLDEVSEAAILDALYEQYNFWLDEGTFLITPTDPEGNVLPPPEPDEPDEGDETEAGGDGEVEDEQDPPEEPPFEDQWYRLDLLPNHLLLEGYIPVRIVSSIAALGTTIGRLIDLRQYYQDVEAQRYPVELYTKQLTMVTGNEQGMVLYHITNDNPMGPELAGILQELTGDPWVCQEDPAPFNVFGYVLNYNGLRSTTYSMTDPLYPYVIAIALVNLFCTNLTGVLTIGYRNDYKQKPGWMAGRRVNPVPILRSH